MAQITAVPEPILFPRQIDLTSLLSAGLSLVSSVLSDPSSSTSTTSSPATTSDASTTSSSSSQTTSASSTRSSATSTSSSSQTSSSTASAASSTTSPTASHKSDKNTLAIVLGVVLGVVCLLLLALLVCLCLRRRRRHRKEHVPPGIDSDSESYLGTGTAEVAPSAAMKEASATSSESTTSPLSHNSSAGVPLAAAAAAAAHHRDHETAYPPLPAAHQMSSIGRRSSDYAYVPNDPFEDGARAQMGYSRDQQRERERRSRHSFTLDPVREYPMRERSLSETRYPPTRRWTSGSGGYATPSSPQDGQRRIPRKPVGGMAAGAGLQSDWPFEHRRNNARGGDIGDARPGFGPGSPSRYSYSGARPGYAGQRFYAGGSNGSF